MFVSISAKSSLLRNLILTFDTNRPKINLADPDAVSDTKFDYLVNF